MNINVFILYLTIIDFSRGNEYMYLVKDFVKYQKQPAKVNAYLCWHKDVIQKFQKVLHAHLISSMAITNFNSIYYNRPEEHQLFILDISCDGAKEFMAKNAKNFFGEQFRWLILNYSSFTDFAGLYFGVDSHVYVLEEDGIEHKLISIYKYNQNSPNFLKHEIGRWSKFGGLRHVYEYSASRNRSNLMGLNLGVTYVITNPASMHHLDDFRFPHVDSITKNNYLIMRHIVDMMNGTIIPTWRQSWGYLNKTTNLFDGLIGDLQTGKSELGGTSGFFTIERAIVVDYTASTTNTFMKFIFRKPPLTYVTNVFTLPFDTSVWYACFTLIGMAMMIIYFIVLWEWKDPLFKTTLNHSDYISPLLPDVSDICITQVGLITQQGSESEPKSSSGRIATICLMIALMFLYCAYSASIVALLQSRTDSIQSVQDLLTSRIKLGVEDIVYMHYYFKSVNEPLRKTVYDQKIIPKGAKSNFMTMEEGIARMRNDFFAFHVELSRAYKVIGDTFQEHEKCSLTTVTYFNNLIAPYFQIRKNSTIKDIVKVNMRKIQESGVQQREFLKIYTKKPTCQNEGSSFESVGLIDCYAAFLVFGIGVVLAVTFTVLEVLYYSFEKRQKRGNVKPTKDVVLPEYED